MIQDGSISSNDISQGGITTSDIANNTITSGLIIDGAVTGSDIAGSSITAVDLAAGAVTSVVILDGSIIGTDIAAGAIGSVHIADGSVQASKLSSASKKRAATVQIGDITGSGKKEKALFVAPTNGNITKITLTNSVSHSAAPGKGNLSIERKATSISTVGVVNLSTTNLAAFTPHSVALTDDTIFSVGDVYSFRSDVTAIGSSLSGLLVTIEYEVME